MSGDRAVQAYVDAQRASYALRRHDPADIVDYERHVREAVARAAAAYRALNGSQVGEARRRLAGKGAP
jgi:hypothetical protein